MPSLKTEIYRPLPSVNASAQSPQRDAGRVVVNGKIARASYDVKVNDVIELTLGARTVKARVVSVNEYAKKDEAAMMFEIIEEK